MNPNLYYVDPDDLHSESGACLDVPRRATWISFQILVPPLRKKFDIRIRYRIMPDVGDPLPPWSLMIEELARPAKCQRTLSISSESLAPFGIFGGEHLHLAFDVPRESMVHFLFEKADA